jgi:hypothetical protein
MKKLITASLLLSSMNAMAGWNLKNQKDIYDLMYMPKKGNGAFFAEYAMDEMKYQYTLNGVLTKEIESSSILSSSLLFGMTENFALGFQVNYLSEGNIKTESGTTTAEEKSKGISNPSALIRLRLLEQNNSFANLDIFGGYKAHLGTKKEATTKVNGNGYEGGSSTTFGVALGKKYTDMAWKLEGELLNHGTAKVEDAEDASSRYDIKSYGDLLISGSWQWLFSESFILNVNVGSGKEDKIEYADNSGASIILSAKSYSVGGLDLSYLLNKDTTLGLSFSTKSYDKYDYSSSGVILYTASDMKKDITTLSLKTQF